MHHAFEYFEAQAKLQEQDTIRSGRQQRQAAQQVFQAEQLGLQAGQLALFAGQQALLAEALDTCEPVWQLDAPRKPLSAKSVVCLPTYPYIGIWSPQRGPGAELVPQSTWEAPELTYSSSRSSPPEPPPQTLFVQSTPHAQDIQDQPRVRLPLQDTQIWPFQSQGTKCSTLQQSYPSLQSPNRAQTLSELDNLSPTYPDPSFPSSPTRDDKTPDQPETFSGSYALPSSYSDTALPQTLAKKDRRILGVSSAAGIDEYVPVPCAKSPSVRLRDV
ncbi:MAG: hypothetical protein ASARMPRED_004514 [Alectoria sarmentosa]|nr:MAG: hypothetical protein ASARMPRED_004514 [Alectoria sarmentosa]